MSEATPTAESDSPVEGFMDRHYFLLRRLHSLSGIVPVGMFVIFHLFTNAQLVTAIWGAESSFQHEVDFIHNLPALLFLEIGLWGALAFHAILGIYYANTGKNNTSRYAYQDNWRYAWQRWTGYIAFVFIFFHIATLRWQWDIFGWNTPFMANGMTSDQPLAQATTAMALQHHPLVVIFYLIGALSVVFHWSNGLWTAAITWGVTISVKAQRRWGYVCAAMGAALTVFTLAAIFGALAYDVTEEEKLWIQEMQQEEGIEGPAEHAGEVELDPTDHAGG